MTTDTEARALIEQLFGYQVRTGHTIQSGAGTKAPTLIWADADYEVGDGLCGLHPDQKQANEPSIPYARIDAVFALLAENERLWGGALRTITNNDERRPALGVVGRMPCAKGADQ